LTRSPSAKSKFHSLLTRVVRGIIDFKSEKNVRELLATTNKEYFVIMDKLKRVVASGNFHHELLAKHLLSAGSTENNVNVIDGIPICCKISLKDNEAPLTILVNYLGRKRGGEESSFGDLKVYISSKYTEPSINNNEGVFANVRLIFMLKLSKATEDRNSRGEGVGGVRASQLVPHFLFQQRVPGQGDSGLC